MLLTIHQFITYTSISLISQFSVKNKNKMTHFYCLQKLSFLLSFNRMGEVRDQRWPSHSELVMSKTKVACFGKLWPPLPGLKRPQGLVMAERDGGRNGTSDGRQWQGCMPSVSNGGCCGGSNGCGRKVTAATVTRNGGSDGGKRWW